MNFKQLFILRYRAKRQIGVQEDLISATSEAKVAG